jgi:hypothetical protein
MDNGGLLLPMLLNICLLKQKEGNEKGNGIMPLILMERIKKDKNYFIFIFLTLIKKIILIFFLI